MESNGKALALGEELQVELGGDLDKLAATVQVCLSPAMCSLSTSQARLPPYCSQSSRNIKDLHSDPPPSLRR